MGDAGGNLSHEDVIKLFKLRFKHEALFKEKKQPYQEFLEILLQNGFPKDITKKYIQSKLNYTYDSYKLAKKNKNTKWKYYDMFEKQYGDKGGVFDKYPTWNEEWRLKLIQAVCDAKAAGKNNSEMWIHVELSLRTQDLPIDCCIFDLQELWRYLKTKKFLHKYRYDYEGDCPIYKAMMEYCKLYEPILIKNRVLDESREPRCGPPEKSKSNFVWTTDITETFVQIRLQHSHLYQKSKRIWKALHKIMVEEYGFPQNLRPRDLSKKWTDIYAGYQKAKATNQTSWLYYKIFEAHSNEGNISLNPFGEWQEEWVMLLIRARTEYEQLFRENEDKGWRAIERELRGEGLPIEMSVLQIPQIWKHLFSHFKWKQKYANKGMLNEHWPYYEAMARYAALLPTPMPVPDKKTLKPVKIKAITSSTSSNSLYERHFDEEDDVKLFDLKQRKKPKIEQLDMNACRACSKTNNCVNMFEFNNAQEDDLAHKLWVVCGVMVEKNDDLPQRICTTCVVKLEEAYTFREKCQSTDKYYRSFKKDIKLEIHSDTEEVDENKLEEDEYANTEDLTQTSAIESYSNNDGTNQNDTETLAITIEPLNNNDDGPCNTETPKPKIPKPRKKYPKSVKFAICEICGKTVPMTTMKTHYDSHSTEKKYPCPVCGKMFKFKSGVTIHMTTHAEKPMKTCEVCGKEFYCMSYYRKHAVYHANERKFSCSTCGKRFNSLDILRVHKLIHTGARPFSCDICEKTFRTAGCVGRHKKIVHQTKPTKNTDNGE